MTAPPPRQHSWSLRLGMAGGALLVAWSFALADGLTEIFSREGLGQMADYAGGLWPPESSPAFLRLTLRATLETLAISIAGSALSVVLAGLLLPAAAALPGAEEVVTAQTALARRSWLALARGTLALLRTIPELVWAIVWVFVVGLGPLAGTLALGLHNGGVLGKLWAESIENVPAAPARALRALGAPRRVAFVWGELPLAGPQLLAYMLYRWEVSIRAAAILGFVGAGGLGQEIHLAISLFLEGRLLTLLAAIFVLVSAVDLLSGWLRRRLEARF